MTAFPRTTVGGVSLPRLLIGTNWFLGYSHTSAAKDNLITTSMTRKRIAGVLATFLKYDIDAIMGMPTELLDNAVRDAEQRSGKKLIRIFTPHFSALPGAKREQTPEHQFDICRKRGGTFCFPHTCTTDQIVDRLHEEIRGMDKYSRMIRQRGMIPGLSTHLPEAVVIADKTGADVETYIQIYNAAGFLMTIEADWAMRVIHNAKKPVMTIKPLAAGRLLPPVGLAFVWNTIRDIDMVTIGTMTADEAREVIELSLDFLDRRIPQNKLQETRSKKSLK